MANVIAVIAAMNEDANNNIQDEAEYKQKIIDQRKKDKIARDRNRRYAFFNFKLTFRRYISSKFHKFLIAIWYRLSVAGSIIDLSNVNKSVDTDDKINKDKNFPFQRKLNMNFDPNLYNENLHSNEHIFINDNESNSESKYDEDYKPKYLDYALFNPKYPGK